MSARLVLAGDIGGTKTNLALYLAHGSGRLVLSRDASFPSQRYPGLETIVREFLATGAEHVDAAAFGIAGPVLDGVVIATNLPWKVEAAPLVELVGCERVRLMNDLESTAYGALFADPADTLVLQAGKSRPANRAIIAAGTGLGQALMFWDGARHHPSATEGGHADFAPRSGREVELLTFLEQDYGHVSYERVLSGPGLVNIFRFLSEGLHQPVAPAIRRRLKTKDPAAVIGEAGINGTCPTCEEAVDIFVSIYGAQAGNLALAAMALGGVDVGGGVVTKLLPKVTTGGFMSSFLAKGRFEPLLADVPVRVLLNAKASQVGAGHAARELLE